MRRAIVMPLVWLVITSGSVLASDDHAMRHPSIKEVISMMKGGVAYDVIVERVRRLDEVPRLDAPAITSLMSKGVPDEVLLELAHRRQVVEPCEVPERRVDVRAVLDHPSIQRVLRQLESGVATDEILELVEREKDVPVLDARALRRLTNKGVPDRVLIELVRKQEIRTTCGPVRAELLAAAGADDGAEKAPALRPAEPSGMGRVRVVARSSLPVTYLEVSLDGDRVIQQGKEHQGEAEPGWMLARLLVLALKRGAVVFESDLPAGPHRIEAAFALSQIVETEWDATAKARGQRYRTTKAGPEGPDGEVPVCEIGEGQVCVVVARLVKRKGSYVVAYDTKLESKDRRRPRRSAAGF